MLRVKRRKLKLIEEDYQELMDQSYKCRGQLIHLPNRNLPTPKNVTYKLQVDIRHKEFVFDHAERRREANIRRWGKSLNTWNKFADEYGVLGEKAFEIATGMPMDTRIDSYSPYDFNAKGLEIDVKCTEDSHWMPVKRKRLIGHEHKDYWYVFCKGNLETFEVEFVGCISGDKVRKIGKYIQEEDKYIVHEEQLGSIEKICEMLKERECLNGCGEWK